MSSETIISPVSSGHQYPGVPSLGKLTAVYFLFFVSGATGLVYEVVWSRMLVLVTGNTAAATSLILAAFMAGLTLGSFFWGRFVVQWRFSGLVLFGCLEAATGLLALCVPVCISRAAGVEAALMAAVPWHQPVRFGYCFLVLLGPAFLMGGTYAVLGHHIIRRRRRFGRHASLLYAVNTLGAAAGSLLTGFLLIRLLGHTGSITAAALVNLAVGGSALFFGLRKSLLPDVAEPDRLGENGTSGPSVPRTVAVTALVAVTVNGFCSIAYQVLWTRLLVLVVDNSVYSFAFMLTCFLLGMGLGSLWLGMLDGFVRRQPVVTYGLVCAGMGISSFFVPFFIACSPPDPAQPYWVFLLQRLPPFVFVPTLFMGMSVPLAARLYAVRACGTGKRLGIVYGLSTAGGVLGALAAAVLLLPVMGVRTSLLLLPALSIVCGGLLLVQHFKGLQALGVAGLMTVLFVTGPLLMPENYFADKYSGLEPGSELLYYEESLAATATVFRRPDGNVLLYLNGIPEVDTTRLSVMTFKLLGALPCLLHRGPGRALMITFGAGITSGTAALFADRVDCVDLAGQARRIAALFRPVNNGVAALPNATLHIDDARHFLQTDMQRYAVIVSDATHPRSYDSWILYTEEFYRLVAQRLGPQGVFCQWVPFHGLAPQQFASIIATFHSVFPHTSLWRIGQGYAVLAATPEELRIDVKNMFARLSAPDVQRDLKMVGLDNLFELLACFVMGEQRVGGIARTASTVIRDNSPANLFFPFTATLDEQYQGWPRENFSLIAQHEESIEPYLANISSNPEDRRKIIDIMKKYEQRRR